MNQSEIQSLAKAVAKETVAETFLSLGLNIADPVSVQGQFAFLRSLYYGARHARNAAISIVFGMIVSGVCWAVWASIKAPAAATAIVGHVGP